MTGVPPCAYGAVPSTYRKLFENVHIIIPMYDKSKTQLKVDVLRSDLKTYTSAHCDAENGYIFGRVLFSQTTWHFFHGMMNGLHDSMKLCGGWDGLVKQMQKFYVEFPNKVEVWTELNKRQNESL